MYRENAKTALAALNSAYFRNGAYKGVMFWDRAELIEMIEDFCDTDASYNDFLQEYINTSIAISGVDWSANPYFDDILWMCLAYLRASKILNNSSYLTMAKNNFDYVTTHGIVNYGLVDHKVGKGEGSAISSTVYVVVGSMLGKELNDPTYCAKAKSVLDAIMTHLYNPDNGHVFDHIKLDGTIEYAAHDCNFGMFMRGCLEVYEDTKDEKYYDAMIMAADNIIQLKYKTGLMCDHYSGDGAGFKAIYIRQLAYMAKKYDLEDYIVWLQMNADSAWNNRNTYNLMQNDFCIKTANHRLWRVFDCHCAVVLLQACAE